MREILFRGKTETGEWVYWDLFTRATKNIENAKNLNNDNYIVFYDEEETPTFVIKREHGGFEYFNIIPETVGQFTGLTDKNGNKIFEGDIINEKPPMNIYTFRGFVVWDDERALWRLLFTEHPEYLAVLGTYSTFYTVVGNIHDNPELLEEK